MFIDIYEELFSFLIFYTSTFCLSGDSKNPKLRYI